MRWGVGRWSGEVSEVGSEAGSGEPGSGGVEWGSELGSVGVSE